MQIKVNEAIPVPGVSPGAKAIECPAFLLNRRQPDCRACGDSGCSRCAEYPRGHDAASYAALCRNLERQGNP